MSATSERYAKAIFQLAQEQNTLESVENSLNDLRKVFTQSKDFQSFLRNPLLSHEEQLKVLKYLFEGKVPELVYKFLSFVSYKGRLDLLKDIIENFDAMYLIATHQMRAYVKIALPVSDEEKTFIAQKLKDKFQQEIIIRWTQDASLIGGFRIMAAGKLYDYSFKSQLNHYLQQTIQPI